MACPRCRHDRVRLDQRPSVDHYECLACGWTWDKWSSSGSKPSALRALLGLPQTHNPTNRWCECVVPIRYVVTGTLKETVTYCRRCQKYVAIVCPPGLEQGGHYRAMVKRQEELAAREVVA